MSHSAWSIPASAELIRLYADYLNREYGALDSDYVFVNLWGHPRGHPLTYPAVYDLVGRLRYTEASVYTQRDTPMFTCAKAPIDDILAQLVSME